MMENSVVEQKIESVNHWIEDSTYIIKHGRY